MFYELAGEEFGGLSHRNPSKYIYTILYNPKTASYPCHKYVWIVYDFSAKAS